MQLRNSANVTLGADDYRFGVTIVLITVCGEVQIEDLRNHSPAIIRSLRELFAAGALPIADPKRPDFYEVRSKERVYYVYISRANGKVLLLATWT
jgi:hypothetical protein